MSYMFSDLKFLESIDLSYLDFSSVTDMEGMIMNCDNLISVNLSHSDISSVTNMKNMFYYSIVLFPIPNPQSPIPNPQSPIP
jgi:surface protein